MSGLHLTTEDHMVLQALTHPTVRDVLRLVTGLTNQDVRMATQMIRDELEEP